MFKEVQIFLVYWSFVADIDSFELERWAFQPGNNNQTLSEKEAKMTNSIVLLILSLDNFECDVWDADQSARMNIFWRKIKSWKSTLKSPKNENATKILTVKIITLKRYIQQLPK